MTILESIAAELDQREAHIRTKIAQFKKLLRDPEIAPVVERVLANGHARKPAGHTSSKGRKGSSSGGGIRLAIRGLAKVLPKQFTANDVVNALEAKHFKFGSKDHKNAVRDALHALVEAEVVTVVRPAQGSEPQVYAFIEDKL